MKAEVEPCILEMDGRSILRWLAGQEETPHPPEQAHCWELYGRRGVRKGIWKAEWQDAPYGNDAWELYNLEVDLGEENNLALENPEKLKELLAEWDKYAEKYNVTLPNEKTAYGIEEYWRLD